MHRTEDESSDVPKAHQVLLRLQLKVDMRASRFVLLGPAIRAFATCVIVLLLIAFGICLWKTSNIVCLVVIRVGPQYVRRAQEVRPCKGW